jgi:hypothetical protein
MEDSPVKEFRGFQYTKSKPNEPFRMFFIEEHVHLSVYWEFDPDDQSDYGHALPLRIVNIDWERGILAEDPLMIKITGTTKSLVTFFDVIQWLDSVVNEKRSNEPTAEEVVEKLKEMGIRDCGFSSRVRTMVDSAILGKGES